MDIIIIPLELILFSLIGFIWKVPHGFLLGGIVSFYTGLQWWATYPDTMLALSVSMVLILYAFFLWAISMATLFRKRDALEVG